MTLFAVALGVLVGLSLGALGGGGSTLAVPILVFVGGLTAQDATTASLLVVGVASAFGVVGHYRAGNVRLGIGIAFGAAGIVGSRIGTMLNQSIDENVLLLAFSALIMFVAARMYRSVTRRQTPAVTSDAVARGGSTALATRERTDVRTSIDLSVASLAKLAGAATAVGFLTGMFGVGGGFAVVPALVLLLHFPTKEAIGTSLVVITMNAAIALGMRAGDLDFDWAIVAPFLVVVTLGVVIGARIARNLDADRLTRGFAVMLFVVAIYTAASTLLTA